MFFFGYLVAFAWDYLFFIVSLSACLSFSLKCISCRQQMVVSCCFHLATLCLLIEESNAFTLKIIFDSEGLTIAILSPEGEVTTLCWLLSAILWVLWSRSMQPCFPCSQLPPATRTCWGPAALWHREDNNQSIGQSPLEKLECWAYISVLSFSSQEEPGSWKLSPSQTSLSWEVGLWWVSAMDFYTSLQFMWLVLLFIWGVGSLLHGFWISHRSNWSTCFSVSVSVGEERFWGFLFLHFVISVPRYYILT